MKKLRPKKDSGLVDFFRFSKKKFFGEKNGSKRLERGKEGLRERGKEGLREREREKS